MRRLILVFLVLAAVGLLIFKFFFSSKSAYQEVRVQKRDLKIYVNTSGKVRAEREQTASFPTIGDVEMVASTGAAFKKGEILARLKANDLWAALQQSYAALNKARSTFYYYLEVKSQTDATYVGKSDQASQALINQANNNVAAAQDGVQVAQFSVDGALAAYEKAFITAPFDGQVGETSVKVGETVSPGQKVLTFLDPSSFYFEAEVDEGDVKSIKAGQSAEINLDSYPGLNFPGVVGNVDITAHLTSSGGTAYSAKTNFENIPSDAILRSGLNGEAQILSEVKRDVLVVPAAFVSQSGGRFFVLINSSGSYQSREVEIGEFVDGQYEVLKGLRLGEKVFRAVKK